jgi:hypothetical protein
MAKTTHPDVFTPDYSHFYAELSQTFVSDNYQRDVHMDAFFLSGQNAFFSDVHF